MATQYGKGCGKPTLRDHHTYHYTSLDAMSVTFVQIILSHTKKSDQKKRNLHIFFRDTGGANYIGSSPNMGGACILFRQDLARINPSISGCCVYL